MLPRLTLIVIHHFGEAEVTDLGHVVVTDQNVSGGEVSVHDLEGREVLQTLGDGVTPGVEEAGVEPALTVALPLVETRLEHVPVGHEEAFEVAVRTVLQYEVDLILQSRDPVRDDETFQTQLTKCDSLVQAPNRLTRFGCIFKLDIILSSSMIV